MKARLIAVSGWDEAGDIEVPLPVVLGRSRSAGFVVKQPLVSRQHCELYEYNGRLMIRDLGSTNGTRINQVCIEEPKQLLTGDLITLGSVTFRIDCQDGIDAKGATLSGTKDETAINLHADLKHLVQNDSSKRAQPSEFLYVTDPEDPGEDGNCFTAVTARTVTPEEVKDSDSALTTLQSPAPEPSDTSRRHPR